MTSPLRPLFALGFRPFFLAAGIWAVLSLALWLAMLNGWLPSVRYYSGTTWHGHEMLFGYALAVIAGFLLTATRNWTGMATATGWELGALIGLWVAGRLAPLVSLSDVLVATLDVGFPLMLAASLFRPLWWGPNPVNRVFVFLLLGMALASLSVHLQALGITGRGALAGDRLMLGLILLTLLVVAGRIMPFFTQTAIPGAVPRSDRRAERLTFGLAVLWVLMDALMQLPLSGQASIQQSLEVLTGVLAIVFALVLVLRLRGWHDRRVWAVPILAVLYGSYLWMILGLILNGLAHLQWLAQYPALHALTVGAVGLLTLGMMGRVTQGHTGRQVSASGVTVASYLALTLAAVVRVFGPLLWPTGYMAWMTVSGWLWVLAFVLFLGVHGPMLLRPRVDGKPG